MAYYSKRAASDGVIQLQQRRSSNKASVSDGIDRFSHPVNPLVQFPVAEKTQDNAKEESHEERKDNLRKFATVNPFVNRTEKISALEWFKIVLFTVTLIAPLRFLLIVIIFCIMYLFAKLRMIGISESELDNSKGWRKAMIFPIRYLIRAFLVVCGFYPFCVKEKGKPVTNIPIVVANHPSIFEPFWLAYIYFPAAVSKLENAHIPIAGTIMKASSTIFVDRLDPESRKNTAKKIKEVALKGDRPVLIFPEGTNTNGNALISFKIGAFAPLVAVQPVLIRYPFVNFDITASGEGLGLMVYRALCQFANYMEVEYLPPREPRGNEIGNPALFAKGVRQEMAEGLNIPLTEHSYVDVLLQIAAYKHHLPSGSVQLECGKLQEVFKGVDMSLPHLKAMVEQFANFDKNHDGKLTYKEFLAASSLFDTPIARGIWAGLDVNENDSVDFREFLTGMALVSQKVNQEDKLKFVWDLFDKSHTGSVAFETFLSIMQTTIPEFTTEQLSTIFSQIDVEHKGSVNYENFTNFAKQHPIYVKLAIDYKAQQAQQAQQALQQTST